MSNDILKNRKSEINTMLNKAPSNVRNSVLNNMSAIRENNNKMENNIKEAIEKNLKLLAKRIHQLGNEEAKEMIMSIYMDFHNGNILSSFSEQEEITSLTDEELDALKSKLINVAKKYFQTDVEIFEEIKKMFVKTFSKEGTSINDPRNQENVTKLFQIEVRSGSSSREPYEGKSLKDRFSRNPKIELDELTSTASAGAYSTRATFLKNKNDLYKQKTPIKGATYVKPKTSGKSGNSGIGFNYIAENYNLKALPKETKKVILQEAKQNKISLAKLIFQLVENGYLEKNYPYIVKENTDLIEFVDEETMMEEMMGIGEEKYNKVNEAKNIFKVEKMKGKDNKGLNTDMGKAKPMKKEKPFKNNGYNYKENTSEYEFGAGLFGRNEDDGKTKAIMPKGSSKPKMNDGYDKEAHKDAILSNSSGGQKAISYDITPSDEWIEGAATLTNGKIDKEIIDDIKKNMEYIDAVRERRFDIRNIYGTTPADIKRDTPIKAKTKTKKK